MSAQLQPQGQPQATASEGLGLLDDIVARSKVAKTDVEHARAKDIIGELVREVMAGTVTISDNLSASIDARIAEIDRLISLATDEEKTALITEKLLTRVATSRASTAALAWIQR